MLKKIATMWRLVKQAKLPQDQYNRRMKAAPVDPKNQPEASADRGKSDNKTCSAPAIACQR